LRNYVIRRIIQAIPVIIGITIITFALAKAMPGDPFSAILNPRVNAASLQHMRFEKGLLDPLPVQYLNWLVQLLHGNLGTSFQISQPVTKVIADRIGPLNVLVPCATIAAVLALVWIGITTLGGLLAFALVYGFFSGGFVSLPPVAIVTLTRDMSKIGTRMGQCFFISAFGLLVGTPVSGAILKSTGQWWGVQLWSGAAILVTGSLLLWARVVVAGWRPMKRA